MLRVALDEGLYECSLANAWGSDDSYNLWWGVKGETVDLGHMEAFFLDLGVHQT